ncbi:hypothetical protein FOZ62_029915, partial [Perkinsus olseni]
MQVMVNPGNHKIVRVLHQSSKGCEEYRRRVKDEIKRWSMEVPNSLRCEEIDQEMAKLSGIITEAKRQLLSTRVLEVKADSAPWWGHQLDRKDTSPGRDGIKYSDFAFAYRELTEGIRKVFVNMITMGYHPRLGKAYEAEVPANSRLKKDLENAHGYKKGGSTATAVESLRSSIERGRKKKMPMAGGGVASPALYRIAHASISREIIGGYDMISYADDTIFLVTAPTVEELREKVGNLIHQLEDILPNYGLAMNRGKSVILSEDLEEESLLEIPIKQEIKYLGYVIRMGSSWNPHLKAL